MDDFAKRSPEDRADLFRAVAAHRGLASSIIEKDFWVCWPLKQKIFLPSFHRRHVRYMF